MRLQEALERALAEPAGPVENEPSDAQLNEILEAARVSPSAYNMQPWQLRILRAPAEQEEVTQAFSIPRDPDDAQAWILCLMDRDRMLPVADPLGTETYIALGALCLNVKLASAALGLTCRLFSSSEFKMSPWRPASFSFPPNLEPYFVFSIGKGEDASFASQPVPAVYRLDSFGSDPHRARPVGETEASMDALQCVRLRRIDRDALRRGDSWPEDCVRILSSGRRALEAHGAGEVELLLVESDRMTLDLTRLQSRAWRKAMTNRKRLAEINDWLRFSMRKWKQRGDGELVHHFGLGPLKRLMARIGLNTGLAPLGLRFGAGHLFLSEIQASPDTTGAFLTTVLEDPAGRFQSDDPYRRQILTGVGACLEAIWLSATALGASLQFQTSTIVVEDIRAEVRKVLDVPDTHDVLSLIRMGYPARETYYTSVRRDLRDVANPAGL